MPIGLPITGNLSIDTFSLVDSFSFICNPEVKGLLPTNGETKVGALEFLIYPMDENPLQRKTAMVNKPSRLLIGACAEPLEMLLNNPNLKRFIQNYPLARGESVSTSIQGAGAEFFRNIYMEPRLNILNDNFKISVVICSGYSRVAGQASASLSQGKNGLISNGRQTNTNINNIQTEEDSNG